MGYQVHWHTFSIPQAKGNGRKKSLFEISHFKMNQFAVGKNSDVKVWESEFESSEAT